jgi:predicted MFS family arabinose efflux permease
VDDARSRPRVVVPVLGAVEILAWGSTVHLPAVLAGPIAADTGWSAAWTAGAFSVALLVSGLAAPRVGALVERRGGRPVLAGGAALLAAGLVLLGLSPTLPVHVAAWALLGVGMAATLYDAAFAALGRLYGSAARGPITDLTLIAGFASTACWPLSALLLTEVGWRGTCLAYAGLHAGLVLPLILAAYPREAPRPAVAAPAAGAGPPPPVPPSAAPALAGPGPLAAAALAASFAVAAAVTMAVTVHVLAVLQDRGMGLAAAVAVGALLGPAQVAGRLVEKLFGRLWHPVWTLVAANGLSTAGLALLHAGAPPEAAALAIYGAGLGLRSIARGTVPLAMFGPAGYAALMGRIALPVQVAQAAAPFAAALVLERGGAGALTLALASLSAASLALCLPLLPAAVRAPRTA